jgi:CRP-like cAMP-binding protein
LLDSKNRSLLHRINQVSFFDGFSHIEKGKLLEKVEMFKKYEKKGLTIFSEGAKGESMYVILEGVIGITRLTFKHDKEKQVTLAKLKKGSVFGEISLLSNQNRTTGAITDSSLVIVMVIDKKTLESFDLGIQKLFHTQMILTLIRRLDGMNEKYRDVID